MKILVAGHLTGVHNQFVCNSVWWFAVNLWQSTSNARMSDTRNHYADGLAWLAMHGIDISLHLQCRLMRTEAVSIIHGDSQVWRRWSISPSTVYNIYFHRDRARHLQTCLYMTPFHRQHTLRRYTPLRLIMQPHSFHNDLLRVGWFWVCQNCAGELHKCNRLVRETCAVIIV